MDEREENNELNFYLKICDNYNSLLFKICIFFGVMFLLQSIVFGTFIVSYFWSPEISIQNVSESKSETYSDTNNDNSSIEETKNTNVNLNKNLNTN